MLTLQNALLKSAGGLLEFAKWTEFCSEKNGFWEVEYANQFYTKKKKSKGNCLIFIIIIIIIFF